MKMNFVSGSSKMAYLFNRSYIDIVKSTSAAPPLKVW